MTSSYRPSLHQRPPPPNPSTTFLDSAGSYPPPSSCPPPPPLQGSIDPRYQKPASAGDHYNSQAGAQQLRRLAMTGVHSRLALSDFQAVLRAQQQQPQHQQGGEANNNPYGAIPKMELSTPSGQQQQQGLKVATGATYAALEQFRCGSSNGVGDTRLSSAPPAASSYGPFAPSLAASSSTSGANIDGHPYVSNGHLTGYPSDEHVTNVSKA